MKTVKKDSDYTCVSHSFGVVDSKGRDVGALVGTWTQVFSEATPEEVADYQKRYRLDGTTDYFHTPAKQLYDATPGTQYCFAPHATRAGTSFGAIQSIRSYDTAAKRDAAVAQYLKGAQARAVKQWGAK